LHNGRILILDTKKGFTAKSHDTKLKSEALQAWLKASKDKRIIGGIVANVSGIWKLNKNDKYKWDPNYSEWVDLEKVIDKGL
jgi:hypothetical protein